MIDVVAVEDHLHEPREIRVYFRDLESMLDRLREFADKLDPLVLLRCIEHAIRRFNIDLELIDYAADFLELSMDMLTDLHRAAMDRMSWTPKELASYLVDRGIGESWDSFGSLAELYRKDLESAFHEAMDAEIEARRNALNGTATGGIDQERIYELLEGLTDN